MGSEGQGEKVVDAKRQSARQTEVQELDERVRLPEAQLPWTQRAGIRGNREDGLLVIRTYNFRGLVSEGKF